MQELKALLEYDREPWTRQLSRLLYFIGEITKDDVKIKQPKWRVTQLYDAIVEMGYGSFAKPNPTSFA